MNRRWIVLLLVGIVGCSTEPAAIPEKPISPTQSEPPSPPDVPAAPDMSAPRDHGSSSTEEPPAAEPKKEDAAELSYTTESLSDIAKMLSEDKIALLDVRSQEEWDEGHVESAKFLSSTIIGDPSKSDEIAALVATFDKDKPVYVHCFRGGRAMRCAKALAETGLDVRPIQAKFEDFAEAGFKVVK